MQWGSLGLALILCFSLNQETWATLDQLGFHASSFNDEWGQTYLIHLVQSVHRSVGYVTSRRGKGLCYQLEREERMTRAKVVEMLTQNLGQIHLKNTQQAFIQSDTEALS